MLNKSFSTKLITMITVLLLTLSSVQPALAAPLNDDFANATVITSLPFEVLDLITAATIESGEPQPFCGGGFTSIWYRFTPTARIAVEATISASFNQLAFVIYTGNSLDSLTPSGTLCSNTSTFNRSFILESNTTYYFQIGSLGNTATGSDVVHFQLEDLPPPQAAFSFSPANPLTSDNIQFQDATPLWRYNDGLSTRTFTWDFGDGATSTVEDPTHQYFNEGDYTVQHSVTVAGFTTSTSQVVQVRTHDVAITRLTAPSSARLGQTRPITVYIKNNRYAETVLLEFYKSNPNVAGGFELVGSYTQFVPVRSGSRTSTFTFNYTFTTADLAVGKVTFKAVATLVNGRDAIPSDNELISSPPTIVKR